MTGAGLIFYFRYEKERMQRKRVAEASKGVGKPKIGGPFELIDMEGKTWTEEDLKGKYALVSLLLLLLMCHMDGRTIRGFKTRQD
jgi:protein SCO1/2